MSVRSVAFLSIVAACAAPLAAQCSGGPFIGAPFGLSTAEQTGSPFVGAFAYHKDAGYQISPPAAWTPQSGWPDFRLEVVFPACGLPQGPFPDVDAMSLGEDWILADDTTGRIQIDPQNWGGLTFSVSRTTLGAPGSTIRASAATTLGAGGDVFSWILPGSAMPAPLVGQTELLHRATEIDLGATAREVDALDFAIEQWRLEPGLRGFLLDPPSWYFSVSSATVALVPPAWWGGTTPSGATILQIQWQPSTGSWSCPQVFKTYADLGLSAREDVDALAIDVRNQRILFSTKTPGRNQILFVFCGTDSTQPVPYSDPQGVPVTDPIGLIDDDDIDAICAIDPSVRALPGGGANAFWFAMGTPRDKSFGFPPARLSSSAFRTWTQGNPGFATFVTGWPQAGVGPGVAALFLSLTSGPLTLFPVQVVNRQPNDPICGNPVRVDVPVPPTLSLHGADVDLRWIVGDAALTSIGEAYPVRIRL